MRKFTLFLLPLLILGSCAASRTVTSETREVHASRTLFSNYALDSLMLHRAIESFTRLDIDSPEIILLSSEGTEVLKLRARRAGVANSISAGDTLSFISQSEAVNTVADTTSVSAGYKSDTAAGIPGPGQWLSLLFPAVILALLINIIKHR